MVMPFRGGVLYSGRIDVSGQPIVGTEYTLSYCIARRTARDYKCLRNWLVMGQNSERSDVLFLQEGLCFTSEQDDTLSGSGYLASEQRKPRGSSSRVRMLVEGTTLSHYQHLAPYEAEGRGIGEPLQ